MKKVGILFVSLICMCMTFTACKIEGELEPDTTKAVKQDNNSQVRALSSIDGLNDTTALQNGK